MKETKQVFWLCIQFDLSNMSRLNSQSEGGKNLLQPKFRVVKR